MTKFIVEARNESRKGCGAWSDDYTGAGVTFDSETDAEIALNNLRATDSSWDDEGWELRVTEIKA
jgi:hypothetical protein